MTIDNLMSSEGDQIYYTEAFRNVLEDHMPFFRNHPSTKYVSITPAYAYANDKDFIGLLNTLNVPRYLHWLIMRMNDLSSPQDFDGLTLSIITPDPTLVQRIKAAHTADNRIS